MPSLIPDKYSVHLLYPYKSLIMGSSSLGDAIQCTIDFTGLDDDKNRSKHGKKFFRRGC
jgi:hypothetical protein